ncbi:MotA/TolQ/ExbB proton channel family protein, partial [Phaeovulum sp.]|uniref:MotA/TolQ/ExbB proton channel family protein n=1 Tax=Phaeovulum sp. TaxID=2934796 RepID=UPI003569FC96
MSDLVVSDLTPMGMYENADIVVQSILILLVCASILTWTVLFAKSLELAFRRFTLRRGLSRLRTAQDLGALGSLKGAASRMLDETRRELSLSGSPAVPGGIKERVALRLGRVEAREGRRLQRGTGLLATIGAVGPFVGLFGTVWGIMNSFVSIAQSQTTNLAVVAP